MVAAECEGGLWNGRHTRATGFEGDCYKYNEATRMGWRVVRFTPKMIKNGDAIEMLTMLLGKSVPAADVLSLTVRAAGA